MADGAFSASGVFRTSSAGSKIMNGVVVAVITVIVLGAVWIAVLIWPALVIAAHVIGAVAGALYEARWWLLGFEAAVVYSWAQDWKEARLRTRSWKHGWLVAHRTVFVRAARRAGWVKTLAATAAGQLVKTPALDAWRAPRQSQAVVLELGRARRDTEAAA
jgi:hypothetical protein